MSVATAGPPARPDAPPGAIRPGRRWLPVAIVAGVIVVTVLGGFLTAAALPAPEARPLTVGGVVTVRPPPGWAVVHQESFTLPSPDGSTLEAAFAQLARGNGALDLLAIRALDVDASEGALFYVEEVLRHQLERLSISAFVPVVLRSGLPAVRFGYIGTEPRAGAAIEGSVTVAVGPSGAVAVFDGWGSQGQLELIAEELDAMIGTAEVA